MLEDVAGSRMFSTAFPDSVTSVTCAQCEPAFVCEEHKVPVANLPILVFSGKCTVLGCKHNPHLWTSGPHTTLMESVCALLEVILQGSGSALAVLLLLLLAQRRRYRSCCWVVALLLPPPRLLMYWPVSW